MPVVLTSAAKLGIAAASVVAGVLGFKLFTKERKKTQGSTVFAPPGHPISGLPSSGAGAPVGITPPGVSQPPGQVISLPPVRNVTDALHDAAGALLQGLQQGTVGPGYSQLTETFQSLFNRNSSPSIPLATDGKYGPKTQAGLQSVITPSVAPSASMTHPVVRPANPAPAPNPVLSQDAGGAAEAVVTLFASGAKKGSFPQVSTFQAAYNAQSGNTPLVPDGKYGGMTENALKATLAWSGSSSTAPKNAYGAAPSKVPVWQGSAPGSSTANQALANQMQSQLNAITSATPGQ
jgi:hypothetical protein